MPGFRRRLNGEVKQDGPFTDMIFGVDAIIAYVAAHMTLWPGDLIATGTPSGVGPMLPGSVEKSKSPESARSVIRSSLRK